MARWIQGLSSHSMLAAAWVGCLFPHPTGSPEHDRVRDLIVRRLGELGIEARIQETTQVISNRSRGMPKPLAPTNTIVRTCSPRRAAA